MFWISFADPGKPAGTQLLGVAIVPCDDLHEALLWARDHGCNPGGEVLGTKLAWPVAARIKDSDIGRLLTLRQAEAVAAGLARR